MTKWKRSISSTPTRIARPRMTSASTMPQNSSLPRCAARHGEGAEDQQEDEEVVERQRALDQVDGEVVDGVVAAGESAIGSATSTPSTNQPMLQTTLSRKLGSRPRAKKRRSTSRSARRPRGRRGSPPGRRRAWRGAGTSGGGSGHRSIYEHVSYVITGSSGDEERDAEDHVDRQQLQPLEPRRLALLVTWLAMRSRAGSPPSSKPLNTSAIGCGPEDEAREHEHRRDEQRDLRARADRDVHRQVHLVLARDEHRDPVLGRVADDRDDDRRR